MKSWALLIKRLMPALLTVLVLTPVSHAEEPARTADESAEPTTDSPWGFNLSLYLWTAGIKGNMSAGPFSRDVNASFIDINSQSRRVPLGFMGRLEGHYDRFGLYLDGNYMDLALKPLRGNLGSGIDNSVGLLDYGAMYRIFGANAADTPAYKGKKRPNMLEVYVAGRTLWLENSVTLSAPFSQREANLSVSHAFTSPILGGRFLVDFTPEIFALVDANGGGFGVQSVTFTGSVMGLVGYRLMDLDMPLSIQAGYKALRYDVDKGGPIQTSATLNGPFLGVTGYW
ncbi:hypothetical protein JCM19379_18920 [Methyloparacoccus murrellii]